MDSLRTGFEQYIERLEKQAEPSKNDVRYGQYVHYANCFLEKFGMERVYMVGSTGDRTKLAWSKDDGDADILVVSGKLEISVENLEFKPYNPCYVWIHADNVSKQLGLQLIDSLYLSAHSLRELKPELFTILRAIHSHVTAGFDRLPEAGENDTIITVTSKVGLASTKYRNFRIYGDIPQHQRESRKNNFARSEEAERYLTKRMANVEVHEYDMKMLQRIMKVLKVAKRPGGFRDNSGKIAFFATALEDALKRPKLKTVSDKGDCGAENNTEEPIHPLKYENSFDEFVHRNVRVAYKEKHHRDVVPALRVKGEIMYMQQWKRRVKDAGWEESKIKDIYNTDVFVVSRIAPVSPNFDKDFCLSFNLAEQKLVKLMTNIQRKVFLVLKSFLKGTFERRHSEERLELKFKTYHMKTLLFWLYETYSSSSMGTDTEKVQTDLNVALNYLRKKLIDRELLHYFVPSNLFVDFKEADFRVLLECVDIIKCDISSSFDFYFKLNDGKPVEKWLSEEETKCILQLTSDGGRSQHIDRLEDAVIDLQIGFNDSERDCKGRSPIKAAVIDTVRLYLNDEKHIDFHLFKKINGYVVDFIGDKEGRMEDVDKMIANALDIVSIFNKDVKKIMTRFGGKEEMTKMLHGAFVGKAVDFSVGLEEQIIETIDRYLSCDDTEEDNICAELKYKLLGYFSGRKEFPHLTSLRI
ncbi:uncharacterized protein LOC123537064 isoform X2 [Mercenaria mercenaria]|nr:uncharacterized protein LOC123537064 isoform X2 [Mercenaria mercenaria]